MTTKQDALISLCPACNCMTHTVDGKCGKCEEAKALQDVVDYLYKIDGDVDPITATAIGLLRQLINEEFVAKKRQVSSQLIYDMLKEVL